MRTIYKYHPETNKGRILRVLQEAGEPLSSLQISKLIDQPSVNKSVISNAMRRLVEDGYVLYAGKVPSIAESGYKLMVPAYVIKK